MAEEIQRIAVDLWDKAVKILKSTMSDDDASKMERHFPSFLSRAIKGDEILIGVAAEIQAEMFQMLYAKKLGLALQMAGIDGNLKVKFYVDENANIQPITKPVVPPEVPREVKTLKENDDSRKAPVADIPKARSNPSTMPLDENYTFKKFVKGPSNSYAYAAAVSVAKAPGKNTNPLFIWGGTGLGKTHLMQSIGHHILSTKPNASVCYITSETFFNEFINAIQNNERNKFRNRYRKVDILLIDDVQFMIGKETMQVEFFNTFNDLLIAHKQIVMTCDVAPKDLNGVDERLKGRFSGGMVVEIESPSFETRLAILKTKMSSYGKTLPDEVLFFIAENIHSHVRAMEGALKQVMMVAEMSPEIPLTKSSAAYILKDSIEEETKIKKLTIDEIIKAVAEYYDVTVNDICTNGRTTKQVIPRHVAMFLAKKLTSNSLKEIGRNFGRAHATIIHGCQTIQERMEVESDLMAAVKAICAKLGRNYIEIANEDGIKYG